MSRTYIILKFGIYVMYIKDYPLCNAVNFEPNRAKLMALYVGESALDSR